MFSLLDIETTGVHLHTDKIVEIAIYILDQNCTITDRFVTLVNPLRDVGPTRIHGITATMLKNAPTFSSIAPAVLRKLQDTYIIAHNTIFDATILTHEIKRALGMEVLLHGFDTLKITRQLLPHSPGHSLGAVCDYLDIGIQGDTHTAEHDVQLLHALWQWILEQQPINYDINTLQIFHANTVHKVHFTLPGEIAHHVLTRDQVVPDSIDNASPRLIQLIYNTTSRTQNDSEVQYLVLLKSALEDHIITLDEEQTLKDLCNELHITPERQYELHRTFMNELVGIALQDGVITQDEHEELEQIARALSILDIHRIINTETEPAEAENSIGSARKHKYYQKSICFTGDSNLQYNNEHLTRGVAQDIAISKGCIIKNAVSKKLDVLVAADIHTLSNKAKTAQKYGVAIIPEKLFWDTLRVPIQ